MQEFSSKLLSHMLQDSPSDAVLVSNLLALRTYRHIVSVLHHHLLLAVYVPYGKDIPSRLCLEAIAMSSQLTLTLPTDPLHNVLPENTQLVVTLLVLPQNKCLATYWIRIRNFIAHLRPLKCSRHLDVEDCRTVLRQEVLEILCSELHSINHLSQRLFSRLAKRASHRNFLLVAKARKDLKKRDDSKSIKCLEQRTGCYM
jgi:hypothetical protein